MQSSMAVKVTKQVCERVAAAYLGQGERLNRPYPGAESSCKGAGLFQLSGMECRQLHYAQCFHMPTAQSSLSNNRT